MARFKEQQSAVPASTGEMPPLGGTSRSLIEWATEHGVSVAEARSLRDLRTKRASAREIAAYAREHSVSVAEAERLRDEGRLDDDHARRSRILAQDAAERRRARTA